ncbi:hypothetical protein ABVT39_007533 [Epinephelus coioides]
MFTAAERADIHQQVRIQISRFREGRDARWQEPAQSASGAVAPDAAGPAPKRRALAEFEEAWENVREESDNTDDEIQVYLRLNPTMGADGRDVLSWSKQHKTTLLLLARLARMVLSVPASSSSSSECAFSAAGRVIEERKTGLAPETVDSILFLHDGK